VLQQLPYTEELAKQQFAIVHAGLPSPSSLSATRAGAGSAHWPQFRGPNAAGVSVNPRLPDTWSATENVAWKTDLPGRSWSSPIVWGERVFLTTVNASPLYYEGRVYVLYDRGLVSAYDVRTGNLLYDRERLPKGFAFTSSPWAANGRVFCLNEDGVCYVLRAGDTFELLHTNTLADDDMWMATPAVAGDRLLIRTAARLYCLRTVRPDATGSNQK
jgi:outer membrane protein assembly factor BamB